MKACLTLGGLLLLMGGCSVANSYVVEVELANVPRMTCAQLARNGPPADGQVTLTDLKACSRGFVAIFPDAEYGHLDLYVPAYPAGLGKEPEPRELAFLLQVWDDGDRRRLLEEPGPFEGTCWVHKGTRVVKVSRWPGQVEPWARTGLEAKYPGIRLAETWVLTFGHGWTPTAERARSAWRYGIGELLLAAIVLGAAVVLAWQRPGTQGSGLPESASAAAGGPG